MSSSSGLKVAVVGANGKIGRLLINRLKNNNADFATPIAIVRTTEQETYFQKEIGVEASLTSIEDSTVTQLAKAFKGCDAVVFTAGAGGKGIERIFTVDLDGCRKTLEACQKAGIDRLLVVSAIKADVREFWYDTALRNYYIAKSAADEIVKASSINYTILHPGSLTLENSTGKYQPIDKLEDLSKSFYSVSREDVALALEYSLLNPKLTARKVIPLANGNQPIEEYFKTV